MAANTQYQAGSLAPISGVYLAFHGEIPNREGDRTTYFEHRAPHEVMVIRGEELPSCRVCGQAVRFEMIQAICYVCHDLDFAGLRSVG
jgi:hypothetical protein